MPTSTTNFSFDKPTVGGDTNAWGGYLNGNWDSVDTLLLGLFNLNRAATRGANVGTGGIWNDSDDETYYVYDGTDDIPFMQADTTNNWMRFILDADADSHIEATADDVVAITIGASVQVTLKTAGIRVHNPFLDANDNEILSLASVASAVNYVSLTNAATGTAPKVAAVGDNTDIDLELAAKGTGNVNVTTGAVQEAGVGISPIGQQTIWVPAGAMVSRTTTGAASGSIELATNDVMLTSYDFDTAADEHVQFAIQMPKGWDEGTIIAQFVWSHPATATNFGVVWFIQAVAFADGDAGDTAFGTAVSATDTGGTTDDIYISPETSAMTVAGTPGAEEYVIFQIYRDVSDASDTLAVDARLHGVKLHYTLDAATDN